MKHLTFAVVLAICVCAVSPSSAAADDRGTTLTVLFIGNSYTARNDLPAIIAQLARYKGQPFVYAKVTPGGRSFEQHVSEKNAVAKIKQGGWDVVVFQNQSFEGVVDPDNMVKFGTRLAAEVDKVKARTVLYETWAYAGMHNKWKNMDEKKQGEMMALLPVMFDRLEAAYTRLAKETDSDVAPVGLAWEKALKGDPKPVLHTSDNSHPSPLGSYLAGLVFYATLFDDKPVDMPTKFQVPVKRKGEKSQMTTVEIDPETRRSFEKIAWQAVVQDKKRMGE